MSKLLQGLSNLLRQSSSTILHEQRRGFNSNRAIVTRVKRAHFTQVYPVQLVNPDGSTVRVKYPTPRIMLKLPLDFEKLSTEEKRKVKLMRLPKDANKKKEKVAKVAFDPMKYARK